jgi:hypothetical protein
MYIKVPVFRFGELDNDAKERAINDEYDSIFETINEEVELIFTGNCEQDMKKMGFYNIAHHYSIDYWQIHEATFSAKVDVNVFIKHRSPLLFHKTIRYEISIYAYIDHGEIETWEVSADDDLPEKGEEAIANIRQKLEEYIHSINKGFKNDLREYVKQISDRYYIIDSIMSNDYIYYDNGKIVPNRYTTNLYEEEDTCLAIAS